MAIETKSFEIHEMGDVTGKLWSGRFESKVKLSHRDYMLEDQHRRQLLGDKAEYASPRAQNAASIFATISSHLTVAPEFWTSNGNGMDLDDENVVQKVYDNVVRIEREWFDERAKKAEGAKGELKDVAKEMKSAAT